jgi:predicted transcriptional regulator
LFDVNRYIYLLGNKTERREALRLLRYQPQPYPKPAAT